MDGIHGIWDHGGGVGTAAFAIFWSIRFAATWQQDEMGLGLKLHFAVLIRKPKHVVERKSSDNIFFTQLDSPNPNPDRSLLFQYFYS